MSEELSTRVERGARWLDETRPGWWREIDLGALELSNSCRCVLGQLWPAQSFDGVLGGLNRSIEWAGLHGFTVYGDRVDWTGQWRALDEAWIDTIKARFEAGSL